MQSMNGNPRRETTSVQRYPINSQYVPDRYIPPPQKKTSYCPHFLVTPLSITLISHSPDSPEYRDFARSRFRDKKCHPPPRWRLLRRFLASNQIPRPTNKFFSDLTPCHFTPYDNPKRFFLQLGHHFCYKERIGDTIHRYRYQRSAFRYQPAENRRRAGAEICGLTSPPKTQDLKPKT
jgi:hypothetical protein